MTMFVGYPVVFFLEGFCDVAKVAIIHGRFSQMWLQDKYEIKYLKTSFHIFGYLPQQCVGIMRCLLNFG